MTQDELKEAMLAALLDYEALKKTRRSKVIKKALQGTVMATVIGSTGFTGANDSRNNQTKANAAAIASSLNGTSEKVNPPQDLWKDRVVWGAAFFGLEQYRLTQSGEESLKKLVNQLPRFAEITVIGCTDSTGAKEYNEKLGRQRAQTVANYLSQHGIMIKTMTNIVSANKHAGWVARRVDLVVNPTSLSQIKHPAFQSSLEPEAKTALPVIDDHDNKINVSPESGNERITGVSENSQTKAAQNPAIQSEKGEQPSSHRNTIQGVLHFAFDQHTLTLLHKERLMELIKQLPRDAEVTVIGRTDIYGADQYNKILGMQRSKSVAIFLANQGVKIKAVGSKLSKIGDFGWKARRVDIIVDTHDSMLEIKLPELAHTRVHHPNPHHKTHGRLISSILGKKPSTTDDKDIDQWKQRAQKLLDTQLK